MPDSIQIPRYKCHKEVAALKIKEVQRGFYPPKSSWITRFFCQHEWYFIGEGQNIFGIVVPEFRCHKCGKEKYDWDQSHL